MATKRGGLGTNLDSLIPTSLTVAGTEVAQQNEVPVSQISPNPRQPRTVFNEEAMAELVASIKSIGILQPPVVRKVAENKYELIMGERRFRAAKLAGLTSIPVIIRQTPDNELLREALIENIQREDLNAMEESLALQRLQQEFQLTQQQVADAVGKSRSAVTNLMRLTSLELEVQKLLERGDLELGHAKCLLALDGSVQVNAARTVAGTSMTVRQTEALVKKLQSSDISRPVTEDQSSPDIKRLENDISEKIGVPVMIQHSAKGAGKLIFKYSSVDELDGILDHLK